jgi:hypothetical protein
MAKGEDDSVTIDHIVLMTHITNNGFVPCLITQTGASNEPCNSHGQHCHCYRNHTLIIRALKISTPMG